jgi:hypothetical protein
MWSPHRIVAVGGVQRHHDLVQHGRVHRVESIGPMQGERGHAVLDGVADVLEVRHGILRQGA